MLHSVKDENFSHNFFKLKEYLSLHKALLIWFGIFVGAGIFTVVGIRVRANLKKNDASSKLVGDPVQHQISTIIDTTQNPKWTVGEWTPCSLSCDSGVHIRSVTDA